MPRTNPLMQNPRRMVAAAALLVSALVLSAAAARDVVTHIRPLGGPRFLTLIAPPDSATVARQFALALAKLKPGKLPTSSCWPCRARAALRRDPLGPGALAILGLYAQERGNEELARQQFRTAARLSRRDPVVQLWMIEQAGRAGDVDGMLEHYDQLLSVKPETGGLLYGRLLPALEDSRVRRRVADFIRARRPWVYDFLNVALGSRDHLPALANTFAQIDNGRPPDQYSRSYQVGLIPLLAQNGDYAVAWEVAQRIAGADNAAFTEPGFTAKTMNSDFAPFVWTPGENRSILAQPGNQGRLHIEVAPGTSGTAVYRLQMLRPGRYRLRSSVQPAQGMVPAEGHWEVYCLAKRSGQRLLSTDIATAAKPVTIDGEFAVSGQCAAVRVAFEVDAADAGDLAALELTRFELVTAASVP